MTYFYFLTIIFLLVSQNVHAYSIFSLEKFLLNTYQSISLSLSTQTIFFISILFIFPLIILMMTCFTRVFIILSFLKNAIGIPCSISYKVLTGISLFITFCIMQPVCKKIYSNAYIPFIENKINVHTAVDKGVKPLQKFMLDQTKKQDLLNFAKLAHINLNNNFENAPIRVLVPAFMVNELKIAFKVGFTILVPFLIIDLLISSILMCLGMTMIPISTISIPLKLIMFFYSNGLVLLISSLERSFYY